MPTSSLKNKKIAILVADGFEQVELTKPKHALEDAGATTAIVSPADGQVRGWNHHDKADSFTVDVALDTVDAGEFDALMLPGGVVNPDHLRLLPKAVAFVKAFFDAGKPVAAICHGPWLLIDAGVVRGRQVTSWPSLKKDLQNAGATWTDREVVRDGSLVTSRKPDDIPAFSRTMIEVFAEAAQPERT